MMFLKLLNMSISASWVVFAVIILRLLLKKAPKALHCALWLLVAFRLICPLSLESTFSLMPTTDAIPEEYLYMEAPDQHADAEINIVDNPIYPEQIQLPTDQSVGNIQTRDTFWTINWLVGMGVMLAYALISFLIVRRRVGPSIPVEKHVRLCDSIDTPFILGILRPKIYLPASLDPETAAHVLAHERAHLKRKDHWWKPLGFLLLCVYWFNPVMWLAYILLCRDIELACDEKVVQELSAAEKKAYSTALLRCSVPRRMIAACPLAFGEVGVKARIKSVLNYKKPAFWIVLVAVIACIAAAVCFLTDPAGMPLADFAEDHPDRIKFISVQSGEDDYEVYTEGGIEAVKSFLEEIQISASELSQNRSEDRDSTHTITLHYDNYDCSYHFSADLTEVWYDDSVKPGLTHRVLNPKNAEEFFLSSIEAPAAERLAPGEYVTTELVYWPLYSSYFWSEAPSYRYLVTEDQFYSEYEGLTFDVRWQWRRAADCTDELEFYFDWYDGLAEVLELPDVEDSSLYQKIDEKHHLLLIDEALYLVEGYDTGTDLTNVSAIYLLKPDDGADVPVTYPESTIEGQESHLYSTISGQVYDVRDAQNMLIRNAVLENNPMSGSVSFESHQILSEMVGCSAEGADGSPVGFTVVDVIAVVMHASQNERTIPSSADNYQILSATITYSRYADGTLTRTEYQENEIDNLADYDLTPLYQQCFDQAVKYWGLNTPLMVDSLLDTISSSPAQYSHAMPYIKTHWTEYEQLLYLGRHTLEYCFDAFLNNQASGIRAEIMAAVCRDIAKSMGENIDFDGQYINGPTWFDVFHAEALKLYETNGLDDLAQTNRASWVLLNILAQTPEPISE